MPFDRVLIRIGLLAALGIAIAVATVALQRLGGQNAAAWAAVAAALSTVTAVIATWNGQRSLEFQEDARQPKLDIEFDTDARYGLVQVVLTNRGQSPAYDIEVKWDRALTNHKGKPVTFGPNDRLQVLNPSESSWVMVNESSAFFQNPDADALVTGTLSYATRNREPVARPFAFSAEHHRLGLRHRSELPRTLYELQKIPELLAKIREELRAARLARQQSREPSVNSSPEVPKPPSAASSDQ